MTTLLSTDTAGTPRTTTAAKPGAILTIILVSYFLILLDNSVVFTGLPSIRESLQLSSTSLSWVQDAYTLVFGGLLLLGARLGDLIGRRRVFITGLAIFVGASFLIGVAPSGSWLIAARALQGIGAAIVAPSSLSLLTASFPEGEARSKAVAYYGATAGIGASLGLLVGGAAASWISWRAGFFINLPIGVAMIALAPKYLPETARRPGTFDLAGAVLATVGTGALVFGVIESAARGWANALVLSSITIAVAMLALLVINEKRADQPILPLRLFTDRRRAGAYLARALYLGAMIGFFFFTTQLMQGIFGFTALQAGLGFLPMTAVNFAVAMMVPRLVRRFGSAALLTAGVVLTLAGMAWLSQASPAYGYLTSVALPMLLIGVGQGLAFAPLTSFGIVDAPAEDAGAASGLVNTFHQLGMALGLAILVSVSARATTLMSQFAYALIAASVLLSACLIVVLLMLVPGHRAKLAAPKAVRTPNSIDVL
ncbi:MFS transporter [Skermania sp. ID1734]|uniref:MFS transporter n=1 Tax=Skermania sp. ID1734 TaxID=2597516 RepID=UPI001180F2FD|nr:MFS transporter [Skermania sp. ID1734]TSD99238.1 MFS transporter [Skermania sp. ID1734]